MSRLQKSKDKDKTVLVQRNPISPSSQIFNTELQEKSYSENGIGKIAESHTKSAVIKPLFVTIFAYNFFLIFNQKVSPPFLSLFAMIPFLENLLTGDSNFIDFLSSSTDAMGLTVRSVGKSNGWIPSRNCVTNGIAMCELH